MEPCPCVQLVCRKRDVLSSAVGVARAVPLYSASSGPAPLAHGNHHDAACATPRTLTVEIQLVQDGQRNKRQIDQEIGSRAGKN